MIGALSHFVAEAPCGGSGKRGGFQPMPPNFGLLPEPPERIKGKRERYDGAYRDRALADLAAFGGQGDADAATPALLAG